MRPLPLHGFILAACLLPAALHGCGKSSPRTAESSEEAGRPGDAGEGVSGARDGGESGRGGSMAGGTGDPGGSGGRASGGNSGDAGFAGTSGAGGPGDAGRAGNSGGGGMAGGVSGGGLGGASGFGGMMPAGASGSGGSAGGTVAVPANWLCEAGRYGDAVCDCGCGLIDIDCPSASADDCEACSYAGCADEACSVLVPDDNSICTMVPFAWTCSERLYNDGSQCDCGCGFRDPDCAENLIAACDKCNGVGSCSGQACPGTINPTSTERCEKPPAPAGWTCGEETYADGSECDCGCGVPDLDCRTSSAESCQQCRCSSGRCPDMLDPEDPTKCSSPPEEWLCPRETWSDFTCDCGCGVPDPACGYHTALYCVNCLGCAAGDCERVDPDDNSRCVQ